MRITLSHEPVATAEPSRGTLTQLTRASWAAIMPRRSPFKVSKILQLQLSDPTNNSRPEREKATEVLGALVSVLYT